MSNVGRTNQVANLIVNVCQARLSEPRERITAAILGYLRVCRAQNMTPQWAVKFMNEALIEAERDIWG